MQKLHSSTIKEDNDVRKILELFSRYYKFFPISIIIALALAYQINRFTLSVYDISSSLLIKEESGPIQGNNVNEYFNQSLFVVNQNFQNELWIMKSSPVIEQVIANLNLMVTNHLNIGIQYRDAYKDIPLKVLLLQDHVQLVNVQFEVFVQEVNNFQIKAKSKKVVFQRLDNNEIAYQKVNWIFEQNDKSANC